ncbi:Dynein heavy chain domain-containing protein 1 [Nibea albiflora]|uniref:Dynein heavy chain domain-containing protein 1 n=1 Tax=Nibea albiflora TaxID=240163 RepID=A0ACB7FJA1_NIBAL|nr:Dynein heavy chain domain-containing protein 1 [Nibea albiflora]
MVARLLVQYRPCLIKSHVAVLKLLVSAALLQHNQLCTEAERLAFLRGLQDIEHPVSRVKCCSPHPTVSQSTGALPSWIPPHIHSELLCLEKIPAFRGLIASLSTSPMQWQEYLHLPSSSVAGTVPFHSHSHLSLLQRALLWKTMLPDCLEGLADTMAVYHLNLLGQTAENEAPHTGNPEALLRCLVKHEGPIILTLPSPKGDKWTSIQPLHLINKLARCAAQTSEVQVKVISFGALCYTKAVLSMLDKAVHDGHWLVFNNCHLLEQWDDKVVTQLSRLISFRAAVRMCALPLVCDSPWDLKEELSFSLQQVVSITQRQSLAGVTTENMELLLRCAIFHSVLLQRQTYKYLGQEIIYKWTQEDLLALMDAHTCIASLCHDKTKALQYIADLSVLQQILEQDLRDAENINDALVLGFSSDVAAKIIKFHSHNLNILLQASQTPSRTARSLCTEQLEQPATLPSYSHARDRLLTLKSYLAQKNDGTDINAGSVPHSPLRDFLQTEWDDLIDSVSLLLSQLQQPVRYNTPTFASLLKLTDLSHFERRAVVAPCLSLAP